MDLICKATGHAPRTLGRAKKILVIGVDVFKTGVGQFLAFLPNQASATQTNLYDS